MLVLGSLQRASSREGVCVEGDALHVNLPYGKQPCEPPDDGDRTVDSVLNRGREPAGLPGTAGTLWPVSEVRSAPTTAVCGTLFQLLADVASPVHKFNGEQAAPGASNHRRGAGRVLVHSDRDSCPLAPGVNPHLDTDHLGLAHVRMTT